MYIIGNLRQYITNPEIYKFMIVGVGCAIATLLLTVFFTSTVHIYYIISVAISLELTLIGAYIAHDKWTFAHVPRSTSGIIRFVKFNIFATLGLGVNEVALVLLTAKVGFPYYISEMLAIIIAFFFNYGAQKKISWKS